MINDTALDGDPSLVLPLGSLTLEGRPFPAPRSTDALLEAAYGPGWRVPDPGFRYGGSPAKRQMKEWFGGFREDRDRWNAFYRATADQAPRGPSAFATWVVTRLSDEATIVDLGCGIGRDVRLYGRRRQAVGVDVSPSAVRRARRRTPARIRAAFEVANLGSLPETLATGSVLAQRYPGSRAVTAHECLDAMSAAARENLWVLCRMLLHGGGRAYVQFAAQGDVDVFSSYPGMTRFVLEPQTVADAARRHGADVESTTLLPSDDEEDLQVCRMVLGWD
jgi:SAM-dependent methyltransferase